MSNSPRSFFPESQQDIARLKQTATDAASDLSSTVAVHAAKAGEHLHDLSGHVREEGAGHLAQLTGQLGRLAESARSYTVRRPLTCIGVALGIGFLLGVCSRGSRDD